jgi:hypothetical protein
MFHGFIYCLLMFYHFPQDLSKVAIYLFLLHSLAFYSNIICKTCWLTSLLREPYPREYEYAGSIPLTPLLLLVHCQVSRQHDAWKFDLISLASLILLRDTCMLLLRAQGTRRHLR